MTTQQPAHQTQRKRVHHYPKHARRNDFFQWRTRSVSTHGSFWPLQPRHTRRSAAVWKWPWADSVCSPASLEWFGRCQTKPTHFYCKSPQQAVVFIHTLSSSGVTAGLGMFSSHESGTVYIVWPKSNAPFQHTWSIWCHPTAKIASGPELLQCCCCPKYWNLKTCWIEYLKWRQRSSLCRIGTSCAVLLTRVSTWTLSMCFTHRTQDTLYLSFNTNLRSLIRRTDCSNNKTVWELRRMYVTHWKQTFFNVGDTLQRLLSSACRTCDKRQKFRSNLISSMFVEKLEAVTLHASLQSHSLIHFLQNSFLVKVR